MTKQLRIIVCTKRDLAGALVLNKLLPQLAGDQVMVLLSDKTRPVEKAVPELAEMKFLERDLPMDTIFPLVDMAGGGASPMATFNGLAARHGVTMKTITTINDLETEALMREFQPDLILSVRFSLIFKRNIFDIPTMGTWNVHPGALPHYAGLFAPFRCLVEGGDRIGCTLHRVDDGIDTGPIQGIGWLPVDPQRSLLWHVANSYGPGLDLFIHMLEDMRAGRSSTPLVQDRSQRAYFSLPNADDFRRFWERGFRLYDPKDYMELLNGFLPPGVSVPVDKMVAMAAEGVGAPCCCARA
ncbi:MAG: methionyl-tRNA formyltransferase [Rhodospirillaceae bacterium]|nr:methionyl-tRNA formyltransferase [Rhodospirillales bacterium]